MAVTAETKIHDLLERYPYLKPWLVGRAPEFAKLDNPVLYNTMARVADLNAAASMADMPVDTLLDEIRTQIAQHEIGAEELAGRRRRSRISTPRSAPSARRCSRASSASSTTARRSSR